MRRRVRWLVGLGLVACIVVAGAIAWEATRPPPPIREFYERIQPGMTKAQVQAVFGTWWDYQRRTTRPAFTFIEGEVTPCADPIFIWNWRDRAVIIHFDAGGQVREKALASCEWVPETWDVTIRRMLGLL